MKFVIKENISPTFYPSPRLPYMIFSFPCQPPSRLYPLLLLLSFSHLQSISTSEHLCFRKTLPVHSPLALQSKSPCYLAWTRGMTSKLVFLHFPTFASSFYSYHNSENDFFFKKQKSHGVIPLLQQYLHISQE